MQSEKNLETEKATQTVTLAIAIPIIIDATVEALNKSAKGLPTPFSNEFLESIPATMQIPVSAWKAPQYPVPWAPSPHDHFLFQRPISVAYVNWGNSNYLYGVQEKSFNLPHTGIDILASKGTPVLAAGDGIIQWSGFGLNLFGHINDPYGYAIVIRHDYGYLNQALYTIYAHLSEIDVQSGDIVKAGDIIGKIGGTGNATGPHLHFEVRLGENQLWAIRNPSLWLSPPIGTGILVGDIRTPFNIHIPSPNYIYDNLFDGGKIYIRAIDSEEEFLFTTYGSTTDVKSDDYYQENFVVPDLSIGKYEITIHYWNKKESIILDINSGEITYFKFMLDKGFILEAPLPLEATKIPFPTATPTLTPTPTNTPIP